jgi:alcohol dehydrogenase
MLRGVDVFDLRLPATTHVGPGSLERCREAVTACGAARAFVVCDQGVLGAGLVERLLRELDAAGAEAIVFADVEPEPTVDIIGAAAAALAEGGQVDLVVSLGGGSVIDTAKAAMVVALNGGAVTDYEDGAADPRPIEALLPHVCVPTTAGTGSEATGWAMFVDPSRRLKNGLFDARLVSDVVILDASLTTSLPAIPTAGSGMDALTHAIEAAVSVFANPATDALALRAASLIAPALPAAVTAGEDLAARHDLLLASFLAGVAFSNSSCGIAHSLAESLGGFYRIAHGTANALVLPEVMAFNAAPVPAKLAEVARALGVDATGLTHEEAALAAAVAARRLRDGLPLPRALRELGVPQDDLPALAAAAAEVAPESGNPREASEEQLLALLENVW